MKYNRVTAKANRQYAKATEKSCRARGSHQDALAIVNYFIDHNGHVELVREALVEELNWWTRLSNGMKQLDLPRFARAVNHLKDGRTNDGKPCTGFSLHYRTSGRTSSWMLVDPAGDVNHRLDVAIETIRGDIQQEVAFRTVNGRRKANAEQAAETCLKQDDGVGHRLLLTYAVEIERFGAVSNGLLAELNDWLAART